MAAPARDDQSVWFGRFVDGEIAGNAWTEVGGTPIDAAETVLDPQVDGYRLSGTKYYTTGSIFAEWADVYARRHRHGQDDDFAIAVVDTRVGGVTVTTTGTASASAGRAAVRRRSRGCRSRPTTSSRSTSGSPTRPRSTS